jgi:hypothetical protein
MIPAQIDNSTIISLTFNTVKKVLYAMFVESQGLCIVLCLVLFRCFRYNFNSFLQLTNTFQNVNNFVRDPSSSICWETTLRQRCFAFQAFDYGLLLNDESRNVLITCNDGLAMNITVSFEWKLTKVFSTKIQNGCRYEKYLDWVRPLIRDFKNM